MLLTKAFVAKVMPLNSSRRFWKKRHQNRSIKKAGPTFASSFVSYTKQPEEKFFVAERKIGHRERKLSKNFFHYMAIKLKPATD